MEKKSASLSKSAMNYGLYLGIVLIVYSLVLYMLNETLNKTLGYVSFVFVVTGIAYGLINFRDKVNGGILQYGTGVGLGVLISLFAGILSSAFSFILMQFIDPSLSDQVITMMQEEALKQGAPEGALEQAEGIYNFMAKPIVMAFLGIFSSVFWGTIISLILAAIFKKNPENSFEEAVKEVE
jgi:hypothetical protein